MRYTVKLHGVIVGHSELEHVDDGGSHAWGEFRPGLGYDLVQPVFRLFAEAVEREGYVRDQAKLERYYKARDALGLELVDARGTAITASAIHIIDYTVEAGPKALALDVLVADGSLKGRATDR